MASREQCYTLLSSFPMREGYDPPYNSNIDFGGIWNCRIDVGIKYKFFTIICSARGGAFYYGLRDVVT